MDGLENTAGSLVFIDPEVEEEQLLKEEEIPPGFFSLLSKVIKEVGFGGDLTKARLPPLICLPCSNLEFVAMKRMRGMQLLAGLSDLYHPVSKAALFVKWYFSVMTHLLFGKKPLNPIIGESFFCTDEEKGIFFFSEQVSHHPAISAFHVAIPAEGIDVRGCLELATNISFTGNISAQLLGSCTITQGDDLYSTESVMPVLNLRGILTGSTRIEYGGPVQFKTPCGCVVKLKFHMKSALAVKSSLERVTGRIQMNGKDVLLIDGTWTDQIFYKYKAKKGNEEIEEELAQFCPKGCLFKFDDLGGRDAMLKEFRVEEQDGRTSREVWKETIQHIRAKDWESAKVAKNAVEDEQHVLLSDLQSKEEEYPLKFFQRAGKDRVVKYVLRPSVLGVIPEELKERGIEAVRQNKVKQRWTKNHHKSSKKKKGRSSTL